MDSNKSYQLVNVTTDTMLLIRDPAYNKEKPYTLLYDPGEDIPRTNCKYQPFPTLMNDLRGKENSVSFDKQGFALLNLKTQLPEEAFYDEKRVEKEYYPEVVKLLHSHFNPEHVEVYEHRVSVQFELNHSRS
jgi:hypothetical protein